MSEAQITTYNVYGGADTIITFNGKVIGEIQSIKYNDKIKELEVVFVNFIKITDGEPQPINYAWLKDTRNMLLEQLSASYLPDETHYNIETGQLEIDFSDEDIIGKRYRRITNVNFLYEKGGVSIDDPAEDGVYVFSYDELSPAYDISKDVTLENMTEYMDKYIK